MAYQRPNESFAAAWRELNTLLHDYGCQTLDNARVKGQSALFNNKYEAVFDANIEEMREGFKQFTRDGKLVLWEQPGFAAKFEAIAQKLKEAHPPFPAEEIPACHHRHLTTRLVKTVNRREGPDFDAVWTKLGAFFKAYGLSLNDDIAVNSTGSSIGRSDMKDFVKNKSFEAAVTTIRENAATYAVDPVTPITFKVGAKRISTTVRKSEEMEFTMSLNDIIAELKEARAMVVAQREASYAKT